jgi:hypothetical protein
MASISEAKAAILDAIVSELKATTRDATKVTKVKELAEAYAWLTTPGQPH